MNTYYLIRHGDKEKTAGDPGLTEKGFVQAEKAGIYLKDKNISVIYSSTYKRTRQTAQKINEILNLKINFDERLRERANWGDVEGQDFPTFIGEWYEAAINRKSSIHGRISSLDNGARIKEIVLQLSKMYENQNIVLVSHGGTIADFVRSEFGDKKVEEITEKFAFRIDESIHECSITVIEYSEGNLTMNRFADITHL